MKRSIAQKIRGRRRVVNVGNRLSRSQIALRASIDRETVSRYLAMKGAPQPDEKMRFDYAEAMAWIDQQAPRAGNRTSAQAAEFRERLLRAQAEEAELDLAVKQGRYVDKAKIKPAFASFCTQLTEDLRTKFEMELPPKYSGKTTIERQQLNAAAIDWVLRRLREGAAPIAS